MSLKVKLLRAPKYLVQNQHIYAQSQFQLNQKHEEQENRMKFKDEQHIFIEN